MRIHRGRCLALGLTLGLAAPAVALAAPCQTAGSPGAAAMAFPKGDATDLPFARGMAPSLMGVQLADVMAASRCERAPIATAQGAFVLTGENGEALPRRAAPVDPKLQMAGYLVPAGAQGGPAAQYMLVIHWSDGTELVKGFYTGIPDDATLVAAFRAAFADTKSVIMANLAARRVAYSFLPPGTPLPPATAAAVVLSNGDRLTNGPQVFIAGTNVDPFYTFTDAGVLHKPSSVTCPMEIPAAGILLMRVDPEADKAVCDYRRGPDLAYDPNAQILYRVSVYPDPGITPALALAQYRSSYPSDMVERSSGEDAGFTTPVVTAIVDANDGRTHTAWFAKKGDWTILVEGIFAKDPKTDVEAATVAHAILAANLTAK